MERDVVLDKWMPNIIGVVCGVVIAGAILFTFAIFDVKGAQVAACRETAELRGAIRNILEEAQRLNASAPLRSPKEREVAVTFYTDAYGRLAPRSC